MCELLGTVAGGEPLSNDDIVSIHRPPSGDPAGACHDTWHDCRRVRFE